MLMSWYHIGRCSNTWRLEGRPRMEVGSEMSYDTSSRRLVSAIETHGEIALLTHLILFLASIIILQISSRIFPGSDYLRLSILLFNLSRKNRRHFSSICRNQRQKLMEVILHLGCRGEVKNTVLLVRSRPCSETAEWYLADALILSV